MDDAGRFGVVLVEPRFPGNVGSVARAMANFGFDWLLLVRPCLLDHAEGRQMALAAWPIVEQAEVHDNLAAALAPFHHAVATTCRGGSLRRDPEPPRSLAARLVRVPVGERVALVFGPEDRGLTNEELSLCQGVSMVPTSPSFSSMNISHAVALFLWELSALSGDMPDRAGETPRADSRSLEGMYRHIEKVLLATGFLHRDNPQRIMRVLRRIFGRAGLDEREVRVIRGIVRQLAWFSGKRGRDSAMTGEDR